MLTELAEDYHHPFEMMSQVIPALIKRTAARILKMITPLMDQIKKNCIVLQLATTLAAENSVAQLKSKVIRTVSKHG